MLDAMRLFGVFAGIVLWYACANTYPLFDTLKRLIRERGGQIQRDFADVCNGMLLSALTK